MQYMCTCTMCGGLVFKVLESKSQSHGFDSRCHHHVCCRVCILVQDPHSNQEYKWVTVWAVLAYVIVKVMTRECYLIKCKVSLDMFSNTKMRDFIAHVHV